MWWWVVFGVLMGVAGLAVLAGFTVRLWRQVRQLGRDVSAANERIARASAELQQLTAPSSRN